MYGRNVFQILQKKGIPTKDKFSCGATECPSDEVYELAQRRMPLYNSSPTFWKSNSDWAHDFHVVSIEDYYSNGFFFRNSWDMDWGNNG